MAAAINVPVAVIDTAGEGGAWGIALLASYLLHKGKNETLETFLSKRVFGLEKRKTIVPNQKDVAGFMYYMERYKKGLIIERSDVEALQ